MDLFFHFKLLNSMIEKQDVQIWELEPFFIRHIFHASNIKSVVIKDAPT